MWILSRVAPAFSLADQQRGTAIMLRCAAALRSGAVGPGTPDPDGCLAPLAPAFPPALREALALRRTPEKYETMASINASLGESAALVVDPQRNYGAMPLVVLSATSRGAAPDADEALAAQLPRIAEEIDRGHDELAALSASGIRRRVPGATHAIQHLQPHVVIEAIEAVVAEARAR